MRTTLDLPEELLSQAMVAAGIKTRTAVIIHVLKELIRNETIKEIKSFRGKVSFDFDLDALRGRK